MVCVLIVTAVIGYVIVSVSLAIPFSGVVSPVIPPAWSGHVGNGVT